MFIKRYTPRLRNQFYKDLSCSISTFILLTFIEEYYLNNYLFDNL